MNNFLYKQMLIASCIMTLTTHTMLADLHRAIGNLSKGPSDICSNLKTPFTKIGHSIAPAVPDLYADITIPLASCALYLLSKQILPEVAKVKGTPEHGTIRSGVAALSLGLCVANFHPTWTKYEDPIDWTIKNGLNSFLIASNAYTIYKINK